MEITKELVAEAIDKEIIIGDGHAIFYSKFYESLFDVSHLVRNHASGNEPKYTIYDTETGEPMTELMGVYNLDFLYWLAKETGVTYREAFGRGTQARNIVEALEVWAGIETEIEGEEVA